MPVKTYTHDTVMYGCTIGIITLCVFCREPNGLKLLMKLYVERSHSLWKEPEVVLAVIMQIVRLFFIRIGL